MHLGVDTMYKIERVHQISFYDFNQSYNESSIFKDVIEKYRERTGHYPERVLLDQIYRTRENRKYCKEKGVRMSGSKLGRRSVVHKSYAIE